MLTRRLVMAGAVALGTVPARAAEDVFAQLEAAHGGRLGVAVLDTGSGRMLRHRADERFAMCSTFKLLLGTAVLQRIAAGTEKSDRVVPFSANDLVTWSPVTAKHAGEGLSVETLIAAILQQSDNTAANLLLATIGGPSGWTAFARTLGDSISRLDRIETALNSAIPGDERDTTTPSAMLADIQKVLLGDVLLPASRQHLIDTLATSTTGIRRLRAGLPADWRVIDKTGTGGNGACNDIAIIYPPQRAPILACAYYTESTRPDTDREFVLADVGRVIAKI